MTARVRVAVGIPQAWTTGGIDRSGMRRFLERAEALCLESAWVVEQVLGAVPSLEPVELLAWAAALTDRIRLGTAVLLMPLRSPVHLAKSLATVDQLSGGRLDVGIGLGGNPKVYPAFGITAARRVARFNEGLRLMRALWTEPRVTFAGEFWQLDSAAMEPKPLQRPHPPVWGATGSPDGHRMMGELGLGLLSFSVGTPPEQLKQRIDLYRAGLAACERPLGAFVNPRAACFTMVNCAPTKRESYDVSRESFAWYARRSAELVASVPLWLEEMKAESDGTYAYLEEARVAVEQRLHELASLDALLAMNAVIAGDPDEVVERCRAYQATGADLLLCLVNPYKIPHEKVMQTIELVGKYVIPEFAAGASAD